MRICSIELIPVTLPYKTPVSDAWGVYRGVRCAIVRITGESGQKGYGEVSLAWFGGVHNLCREAQAEWVPRLIGLDTSEITRINAVLDKCCTFSRRSLLVKAGIEMAVWDLLGKERNLPVYDMLGGKQRERIPITGSVAMLPLEEMAEQAKSAVEVGYQELKIKVGLEEKKDLAAISMIRDAVPDYVRLRVDANMAWKDRKTAKRMMDAFYSYGVEIVEQPLDYRDLEGLAWLRNNTPCRILIDEGIWDWHDAARHIQAEAADLFHVYICEAGGIEGARRVFNTGGAFHIDCTIGSMPEAVVGACAAAHIAAAMPNLSEYPSDIRGFTVFDQDVAVSAMKLQNGYLKLPQGPGLGFEVDEEKLEALRADSREVSV